MPVGSPGNPNKGSPGSGYLPMSFSQVSLGSDPRVISLMPESRQASEIVAHEGGFNLKNSADCADFSACVVCASQGSEVCPGTCATVISPSL